MSATSALVSGLAPPPADTTASAALTTTTTTTITPETEMKQLLTQVEQAKKDIEKEVKVLEKIDTGKRKAEANRGQAIEGRTKIIQLTERVTNLEKQIDAVKIEPDDKRLAKTIDKQKANGLKTLSNLKSKLSHADKHLEKATGSMAPTVAPTTSGDTAPVEQENTKGIAALVKRDPIGGESDHDEDVSSEGTPEPIRKKKDLEEKPKIDDVESDEGVSGDDDDDVVSDKRTEWKKPSPVPRNVSNEEESDSDSEAEEDQKQLLNRLKNETLRSEEEKDQTPVDRGVRALVVPPKSKTPTKVKIDSTPTVRKPSPIPPSPKQRTEILPKKTIQNQTRRDVSDEEEEEEDEEDEEDDDEYVPAVRKRDDQEEVESDHDYDEADDEYITTVNSQVEELRKTKYPPGTQFVVIEDFDGAQADDLPIRKDDILTLIEQRPDDWWIFKNLTTGQEGMTPINHIRVLSKDKPKRLVKANTSATTLVNAFKTNNNIPAGFITSDLAPLTELEEYQLWRRLVPKMTDSNLSYADLHWRVDADKLYIQQVTYQKILTIKQCVKIPRIKGEQVHVINRCVRVCLYNGFEIVSNIHTIRAHVPLKIDEKEITEDWSFLPNNINTLTDEQSQLLIRSHRSDPGRNLKLLIELSQWCQSTLTEEKCEVGCGWVMIPLDDDSPPMISNTKSYNEFLNGGHIDEANVLLVPQYKVLRSNGLPGMIDRLKRARIKLSVESREDNIDVLYDNLPIQPIVVPLNLIKSLVFFRNELAYQYHKRRHPTGISTTPIDSIFLSTFFQTLSQPDLIYALRRVYRSRKRLFLSSSASPQQQREEFIRTYEMYIYPLLNYRQLSPYDFHNLETLNERQKLIQNMITRLTGQRKEKPQDLLSILLDPNLTDKWAPFSADEINFTVQKYIQSVPTDIIE